MIKTDNFRIADYMKFIIIIVIETRRAQVNVKVHGKLVGESRFETGVCAR